MSDTSTPAHRWPAQILGKPGEPAVPGTICATVWPTRSLQDNARWFDELYLWPDGIDPTPRQWSRIQMLALRHGLDMLASEDSDTVGVTLSFATAEKYEERIDALLQANALVRHRLVIMLRGSVENLHAPFRLQAFIEYLRSLQISVGLRVTHPRLTMELATFNLVRPDFAKILAPAAVAGASWDNLTVEARVAGISERWLIVAGLQTRSQVDCAVKAGIGFGQGTAVRPAHVPPLLRPLPMPVRA